MAAPHVAGVAGLLLAQFPGMSDAEIRAEILASVDPLDSLAGLVLTGGRLNAGRALGAGGAPPDTTPPAAVTDLAVDVLATTSSSVTLTWTAPGDDGNAGTEAFLYDVRYSLIPILDDVDFDGAAAAAGEPAPHAPGFLESFAVTGLAGDTTYYLALKTTDDAGNVSALSTGSPSETTLATPPSPWTISVIDSGGSMGTYLGLDFDAAGMPSVAYSDYGNDSVKFAHWNGVGWELELVDSKEYAGVDLAHDADGVPVVTYGWGKLYASERGGSTWDRTVVQPAARNDVTSLRLDPFGNLGVAYRAQGAGSGLKFARRVNGSWEVELAASWGARYMALAYDGAGNPAIAYSSDPDGDGWISAINLARWTGSGWDTELVEEGPVGYGVFAALAFDPLTGLPLLMHRGDGTARVYEWDGAAWVAEDLEPGGGYVSGCALAFEPDEGTAYAAWSKNGQLKLATRAPGSGVWEVELVDPDPASAFHLPMKLGPDGRLYIVYRGGGGIRIASKSIL